MELELETGQVLGASQLVSARVKRSIDPIYGYLQRDTMTVQLRADVSMGQAAAGQAQAVLRHKGRTVATQQVLSCRRSGLGQSVSCATNLDFLQLEHKGGIYQAQTGQAILKELLGHRQLDMADSIGGNVTGHIPIGTRGQAIRLLTFAMGAYMRVNHLGEFSLLALEGEPVAIPQSRILSRVQVTHLPEYSRVELATHSYTPGQQPVVLMDGKELSDQVHTVRFPEPVHWLYLSQGIVLEQGANYITFRPTDVETLTVKPYLHTTSWLSRDLFTPADMEHTRVLSVRDNTLISPGSGSALLESLVRRAQLRQKLELTILVSGEQVGDPVTVQTPWGSRYSGYITQMDSTYTPKSEIARITVMGKEI